jgi:hypothetical protein
MGSTGNGTVVVPIRKKDRLLGELPAPSCRLKNQCLVIYCKRFSVDTYMMFNNLVLPDCVYKNNSLFVEQVKEYHKMHTPFILVQRQGKTESSFPNARHRYFTYFLQWESSGVLIAATLQR